VGSNPTQGMDVWFVYVFFLCLCCPVFRQRPCDGLITRPRRPTICKNDHETEKGARAHVGCRASEKKIIVSNLKTLSHILKRDYMVPIRTKIEFVR
jgi:hypothetical protein